MTTNPVPPEQTWIEPATLDIPPEFQSAIGGHPLLAETLLRRGIADLATARAFLNPDLYSPAPAEDLPGLERASERLLEAVRSGDRIGVWGDFDVDGQTATAILVETLRGLGANVIYHIPVRARESHGINLANLQTMRENGARLVLTCDTGISAFEAGEYARQHGFDLLITDHHSLPADSRLPEAHSLVNPHFLPQDHPLATLCGAGVAYQLAARLNQLSGRAEATPELLDLAALGTVADVATLSGDNRWIVQKGLERLRQAERPALRSMFKLAEVNPAQLNEQHLSFIVAPRLNALGRLGDANPAVEFLCQREPENVKELAMRLENINRERQLLVRHVLEGAQAQIKQNPGLLNDPVLLLNAPDWPGGVIGIVASRLAELYHRPALLVTAPHGELARGSARSVEGIDITALLAANATLLNGYGGHSMAAGFSLVEENLPALRRGLAKHLPQAIISGELVPAQTLQISAMLPLSAITMELVEALDHLAPFGPGNPPLVLASTNLTVRSISRLGKTNEHLQLIVEDHSGTQRRVTWWQGAEAPHPDGPFDLAYTVRASSYRGQRELQIEWQAFRNSQQTQPPALSSRRMRYFDHRALDSAQARQILAGMPQAAGLVIWAEGENRPELPCVDRLHLTPAEVLAIWNIPPSPDELSAALEAVRPQRVYLFSFPGAATQPSAFITRLGGLVRFVIQSRQGQTTLPELAAACAQREVAVRLGLEWLQAKGHIQILFDNNGALQLTASSQSTTDPSSAAQAEAALKRILQETAAYQRFYASADVNTLA